MINIIKKLSKLHFVGEYIQKSVNNVTFYSKNSNDSIGGMTSRRASKASPWVALISVIIGNIALLISLSVLNGFDSSLRNTARKFTSDICVQAINGDKLSNISNKTDNILQLDNVKNAFPVIQTEAIISTKSFTEGVVLKSISDFRPLPFDLKSTIQGVNVVDYNGNEVVISELLAKKINVNIGDKITIYAIKDREHIAFSSASYSSFTVKAIYNTGMQQYDNSMIFMPYNTLESFLEYEKNTANYIEVELESIKTAAEVALKIDETLGYPVFSVTYYDINSSIFAWIELQKEPIPLVLAIISIVASMNIITMLIIIVVEKTSTIGILRTLGLTRKAILQMFMYISLRIACIGVVIGVSISILFVILQLNFSLIKLDSKIYFIDSLPVSLDWKYILIVGGLSIVLSIASSLIPSIIATRILPVKTIRFK